jgi:predicted metal-dependent TIM-barrel fold hydrolase
MAMTRQQILDLYFLEARHKLIDVAAFLDRAGRSEGLDDFRLAARHDLMILAHTPHLEDKAKGTRLTLDALRNESRLRPERVIVDHVEEHTIRRVLDAGFWAGMTLYPGTKCTPARAIDMIEEYGPERLMMNGACDWGDSVPLAVPYAALEMRKRGHTPDAIDRIIYRIPRDFLRQCPKATCPDPVAL